MRPDCDGDPRPLVAETSPVRQRYRRSGAPRPLSGHGRQGPRARAGITRARAGPGDRRLDATWGDTAATWEKEFRRMFLPLLVGTGVYLGSLLSYGMATALVVRLLARLIQSGYTGVHFW